MRNRLLPGHSLEFSCNTQIGNAGIFVLLEFENKLDREISHFNLNSKSHVKCKFTLKQIWFLTVSNLFPLEITKMPMLPNIL